MTMGFLFRKQKEKNKADGDKKPKEVYRNYQGFPIDPKDPIIETARENYEMRKAKGWNTRAEALEDFEKYLDDNCMHRLIIRSKAVQNFGYIEDVYTPHEGGGHGTLIFSEEDGSVVGILFDDGDFFQPLEEVRRPEEELESEYRALLDDSEIINNILVPAYNECQKNEKHWAFVERDKFTGKSLTRYEMEILAKVLSELGEFEMVKVDGRAQGIVFYTAIPEKDEKR